MGCVCGLETGAGFEWRQKRTPFVSSIFEARRLSSGKHGVLVPWRGSSQNRPQKGHPLEGGNVLSLEFPGVLMAWHYPCLLLFRDTGCEGGEE
jgi:hypothetical protein